MQANLVSRQSLQLPRHRVFGKLQTLCISLSCWYGSISCKFSLYLARYPNCLRLCKPALLLRAQPIRQHPNLTPGLSFLRSQTLLLTDSCASQTLCLNSLCAKCQKGLPSSRAKSGVFFSSRHGWEIISNIGDCLNGQRNHACIVFDKRLRIPNLPLNRLCAKSQKGLQSSQAKSSMFISSLHGLVIIRS